MDNRYYIVRCDRASVFAGHIKEKNGQEVTLTDARRIWHWDGAASLSQLAMEGTKRPGNCSFAMPVNEVTVLDAIELIPCTEEAEKSIREVPVWKIK